MTVDQRFERTLPDVLADLYLGPTPDYRDDLLARTARTRQRPARSFPGRWIPMADIASRSAFVPRLPWRTIGVALIIIALVIVGTVVFIGSRQTRLPAPFGVAGNGLIAYASGGDIFTADPLTGAVTSIVTGPEIDANPLFSRDGTKVAFLRRHDIGAQTAYDVVVAAADGIGARVVTTDPIDMADIIGWTPDGSSLLSTPNGKLTRYDVIGTTGSHVVAEGVRVGAGEIRPPDGAQILYEPDSTPEIDLWIMDADGSNGRPLLPATALKQTDADLDQVLWSPDGTLIAFTCTPPDGSEGTRVCLMNADGSGVHELAQESGAWVESDLKWSPDGRRIAFNRWHQDPTSGDWLIQPIGVASVDGGPVVATGPAPASEGALFDWSPDGKMLLTLPARFSGSASSTEVPAKPLVIDVATGNAHEMGWDVASDVSWQRLAP